TEDKGVVLTAGGLASRREGGASQIGSRPRARSDGDVQYPTVAAPELILNDDVGEVGLDARRERRDRREASKVAVRIRGTLVAAEGIEGLTPCPSHGLDRDERQEAVLARQRKLRVDPLDLHHAADVGVEVQTAVVVRLAARGRSRVVEREAGVIRTHLTVRQVDLDAEHGLDPADRELEVGAEPGSPVPLRVAVTGGVAVVDVSAHRRNLVEEPGD